MKLEGKVFFGLFGEKWMKFKLIVLLVVLNNKRRIEIIVVGIGLVGVSVVVILGELGYNVKCFIFYDSLRRVYSIVV